MRVMNGQPHYDFSNRYLRKDGSVVHILWAACWSDEAQARIGVARDVTALREAEDELRFLAHHDPLTRLANRAMFNERLDTALAVYGAVPCRPSRTAVRKAALSETHFFSMNVSRHE